MASTGDDGKTTLLFDNMRKLISVIDELKDVGVQQYIQLPRIAVVGTQSAGKSSLLESIVGIDFLPRGEGVVTRRPLELRLVHVSPSAGEEFKPYAEFTNDNQKIKFYDFDKAREKIIELTEKVAGGDKGIVDNPITMTVYSQNCPDLTLIDLPGITRIAQGGQAKDIERITKDMCRRYAKDSRTIILCVVPANQDMSTSDAIKMAQEEDPEGIRTIGVITKIDIMDKGTNARRMLLGQDIPLKLGYVGVKGRSQQDIKDTMRVTEALKLEKDYFASHPVYSTLPPGYVGTEALTNKLTKVLFGHIKNTLPEISKEIQNKIKECEDRLKDLGEPLPQNSKEKMQLLWNKITDFTENFKNNIRGKYDPRRNQRVGGEISGGAKIKVMYSELYSEFFDKRATQHMTDEHINKAIVLHQGDSIPGFPSVDSFLYLITPLLKQLREPSLELLNNVHLYLETLSTQLIEKIFERFPSIIDDINEIVNRALKEEKETTRELVENVIDSEKTYIFTNDIEYMTQRTSFIPVDQQQQQQQPQRPGQNQNQNQPPPKPIDPEKLFIDEMRTRIDAYFAIVLRNIRDTVPKVIGTFLVKSVQDKLQYTLYDEINKNESIMNMVGEPPHIMAERETLNKVLGVLRKARIVLTKDPDLAPTFNEKPGGSAPPQRSNAVPNRSESSNYSQPSTDRTTSSNYHEEPRNQREVNPQPVNVNPNPNPNPNPNYNNPGPMNPNPGMSRPNPNVGGSGPSGPSNTGGNMFPPSKGPFNDPNAGPSQSNNPFASGVGSNQPKNTFPPQKNAFPPSGNAGGSKPGTNLFG